jgi:hypothetical protein
MRGKSRSQGRERSGQEESCRVGR